MSAPTPSDHEWRWMMFRFNTPIAFVWVLSLLKHHLHFQMKAWTREKTTLQLRCVDLNLNSFKFMYVTTDLIMKLHLISLGCYYNLYFNCLKPDRSTRVPHPLTYGTGGPASGTLATVTPLTDHDGPNP